MALSQLESMKFRISTMVDFSKELVQSGILYRGDFMITADFDHHDTHLFIDVIILSRKKLNELESLEYALDILADEVLYTYKYLEWINENTVRLHTKLTST